MGYADFLHRDGSAWRVADTKLAKKAKVPALLQTAAYADQISSLGHQRRRRTGVTPGQREERALFATRDVLPLFRQQRARIRELIKTTWRTSDPVSWLDARA